MKLSMEWLAEFVDIGSIDIKTYCDRMTATGSKVEGWEELGTNITNVVVGKILEISGHPDADKLVVCKVDVGTDVIQIVTAAKNVFEGAYVPVAKAPANLPNGVKIKNGKLRGVESQGMFCSIEELELTLHDMPGAAEDGILILNGIQCKEGDDIHDVLKLSDNVVEFEITPNRPDCLSVIGLARETGASFDKSVRYHTPAVKGSGDDIKAYLDVAIANAEKCPRYTARVVKNVKIEPSPLWLRMRLRASGVRPINNIVDITNYVMLEYGQPMHAFDYACIDGNKIVVREAAEGENFKSLDDIDHTLSAGMLVISDENKAVALAGVMGGANSEIKDSTSTVVFESANFLGSSVRITSRALGMRTESSGRFEKGLDAENTLPAVERACELVELLGAGEVVDGIIDVYPNKRETAVLKLEPERINRFLGVNLDGGYMSDILKKLDFTLDGDNIIVPSFRQDIECMNDIAEEIIRIYGYNTIEATLFTAGVKTGMYSPRKEYKNRLSGMLCALGYNEIYTFSFISPRYYDKIGMAADDKLRKSVVISNPLGEDTSVMRTCLLPSMMEILERNNNYHAGDAFLYEIAAVYIPTDDPEKLPDEHLQLVTGCYGDSSDFFYMKGVCESVLEESGIKGCRYVANSSNPTFHPGRCAEIMSEDGESLGIFGEIHPLVLKNYGIDKPVYASVLEFERIFKRVNLMRQYKPLPKYPAVTRDLAFVCDDILESAAIESEVINAGGKTVESVKLFDVYRGKQLPEGKKSMAFNVAMRAPDRTLTDEEADKTTAKILHALETKFGVTLRK